MPWLILIAAMGLLALSRTAAARPSRSACVHRVAEAVVASVLAMHESGTLPPPTASTKNPAFEGASRCLGQHVSFGSPSRSSCVAVIEATIEGEIAAGRLDATIETLRGAGVAESDLACLQEVIGG